MIWDVVGEPFLDEKHECIVVPQRCDKIPDASFTVFQKVLANGKVPQVFFGCQRNQGFLKLYNTLLICLVCA
jgi:hypothetical protein